MRAQHKRDVAIMLANKCIAIANAKLTAVQESIVEGDSENSPELSDMDIMQCEDRTIAWVHCSSPIRDKDMTPPRVTYVLEDNHTPRVGYTPKDTQTFKSQCNLGDGITPEKDTPPERHILSLKFLKQRFDRMNVQREALQNQRRTSIKLLLPP